MWKKKLCQTTWERRERKEVKPNRKVEMKMLIHARYLCFSADKKIVVFGGNFNLVYERKKNQKKFMQKTFETIYFLSSFCFLINSLFSNIWLVTFLLFSSHFLFYRHEVSKVETTHCKWRKIIFIWFLWEIQHVWMTNYEYLV